MLEREAQQYGGLETMLSSAVVAALGRAIEAGTPRDLATTLERLAGTGEFERVAFPAIRKDHYSRHLLFGDPAGRFIVLGCTWAPGQMSDLHDHAGFWGAEMVMTGAMEETSYELKEQASDGRFRFERGPARQGLPGAVGVIVPPRDFHTFGNVGSDVSHTLHVYSGNLNRCRLFHSDAEGMWRADGVELCYD